MKKSKKILIITISIILVVAIGFGLFFLFFDKNDETKPSEQPFLSEEPFFNGLSDKIIYERPYDNTNYDAYDDRMYERHYLSVNDYPLLPIEDGRLAVTVYKDEDGKEYVDNMLYIYYDVIEDSAEMVNAFNSNLELIIKTFEFEPSVSLFSTTYENGTQPIDEVTPELLDKIREFDDDCIEVHLSEPHSDWYTIFFFRPLENGIYSFLITYEREL